MSEQDELTDRHKAVAYSKTSADGSWVSVGYFESGTWDTLLGAAGDIQV